MTLPQPEQKIGEGRAYWTHNVSAFPSPVAQFRMAQLIDFDARLYENARIVYRFLCAWYHDEHGDALLSQRHVAKVMKQRAPEGAAVLSNRTVGRAIIALMETGWVARTFKGRGKGRGASRYVPVVNVLELASQGKFPEPGHCSVPVEPGHCTDPVVGHSNGPVDAEPGHHSGPKTLLLDPRTDAGTKKERTEPAAPTAPPGLGLGGRPGAETAGDENKDKFAELWRAYGYKRGKPEARRAYAKLAPDADLHATMVEAATAWRETWAAQNKPDAPRFTLAKWIEREEYDCEPPTAYKPKKRKATRKKASAQPAPVADNDNDEDDIDEDDIAEFMIGSPRLWPKGEFVGEFISGHVDADQDGKELVVTMYFQVVGGEHNGETWPHRFWPQAYINSYQEEGQETLKAICCAVGIAEVEDTDTLLFKPLRAIANGSKIKYLPLAESEAA